MENFPEFEILDENIDDIFDFKENENQDYLKEKKEAKEKILSCLDEYQKRAVIAPLQNVLCIASAGSGKTHMLTNRIAYQILNGAPESSFMLLTFTNKAANEMTERVKKVLNKDETEILSGTFHHIAVVFLRKFAKEIGLDAKFEIMAQDDAESLMGVCRENFIADNDLEKKDFPSKKVIYEMYTKRNNLYKRIEDLNKDWSDTVVLQIKEIIKIYQKRKKEMGLVDFDDLLIYFYKLLKNDKIRKIITDRYRNIFVDEYQDINYVQNLIIELLNQHNSLTVVGDDCQCIYTFRGSRFDYICNFKDTHENALVFELKYNYRSSKDIVDLASQSINLNKKMFKKSMISFKDKNKKPTVYSCFDESNQSKMIVQLIRNFVSKNNKYSDIAILVRSNYLTRFIETELSAAHIPYKMQCGITFFERKHIKTIVAFIKLLYHPEDEISFWKLMELVEGIGAKTAQKIYKQFLQDNKDFVFLTTYKTPKKATLSYKELIQCIIDASKTDNLEEQVNIFCDNFYYNYCNNKMEDAKDRINDIKILLSNISSYKNVQSFLDESSLNSDNYTGEAENEEDKDNKVIISTVHKAKGLEWKKVILPYLIEGAFPVKIEEENDEEEERRLFYVAMTRAREELDILVPKKTFMQPFVIESRFVNELNYDLYTKK